MTPADHHEFTLCQRDPARWISRYVCPITPDQNGEIADILYCVRHGLDRPPRLRNRPTTHIDARLPVLAAFAYLLRFDTDTPPGLAYVTDTPANLAEFFARLTHDEPPGLATLVRQSSDLTWTNDATGAWLDFMLPPDDAGCGGRYSAMCIDSVANRAGVMRSTRDCTNCRIVLAHDTTSVNGGDPGAENST